MYVSHRAPAIFIEYLYCTTTYNHCSRKGIGQPYNSCYNVILMYYFMHFIWYTATALAWQLPQSALYWIIEYYYVIHICSFII